LFLSLGKEGVSLIEGWVLARYAFVEADADLGTAADEALHGLMNGLGDRWSGYLPQESLEYVSETRDNNYVGIGVSVNYTREEGLLVVDIDDNGPAKKAGVLIGDIIIAVDGQSVAGDARETATDLILGENGTKVTLTLLGEDGTQRDVVCTRKYVHKASAAGVMLEGNIGYVAISNFYSGAADSIRHTVDRLCIEGAESLIIDLRSNPGGYIAELKQALDYLLPEGPVYVEDSRWGARIEYKSDANCIDLPMVVLVNAYTYSAAELMAAQLRESIGAPIVGELTSGKGYAQNLFLLPNGGAINMSTTRYCTGSGISLIGTGIVPDVETSDINEQLQTAIDLLKR
jgi:carboxyl-terminal processing protease